MLVNERWQTAIAAENLVVPSLWFYWTPERAANMDNPQPYESVPARKSLVWLTRSPGEQVQFKSALTSWLDQLTENGR
jgi:hypothetical protein